MITASKNIIITLFYVKNIMVLCIQIEYDTNIMTYRYLFIFILAEMFVTGIMRRISFVCLFVCTIIFYFNKYSL